MDNDMLKRQELQPFENEGYDDYIKRILDSRINEKIEEIYMEHHHILPKCMGGNDDENNLIFLYPKEHYYAHKLLCEKYPENKELACAWWIMSHTKDSLQRRYDVDADEYEESKKAFSCAMSGKNNPTCNRERTQKEKDTFAKMRAKQHGKNHPRYGKKHKKESIEKMKKAHSGENSYFWGKHLTEEHKKKISESKKGKPLSLEHRSHLGKPVMCIDTGKIYYNVAEAIRETGIKNIAACCRGEIKQSGGYHWRYLTQEEKDALL